MKKLSKMSPKALNYVVFPGLAQCKQKHGQYDLVYSFWEKEWDRVFKEIESNVELSEEEFHQYSRITALISEDQVVAMQILNDHSLSEIISDEYFAPYSVGFVQNLFKHKISRFQSMRYFIVGENFGVRQTGLNLAAIVLGLSFRQQMHLNFDATITLARKDNASSSTAKKFNMNQFGEDIQMHNVPVGQLICTEVSPHPKAAVQEAVDYLWEHRDFSLDSIITKGSSDEPVREFVL